MNKYTKDLAILLSHHFLHIPDSISFVQLLMQPLMTRETNQSIEMSYDLLVGMEGLLLFLLGFNMLGFVITADCDCIYSR